MQFNRPAVSSWPKYPIDGAARRSARKPMRNAPAVATISDPEIVQNSVSEFSCAQLAP
jgi:hypothetical protein